MIVVYLLREDAPHIEAVQRATRTTKKFGIEPTHGMFGSSEWWEQIAAGKLPVHTLMGKITDVYMASMNDWAEFKMISDAGEESSWTRMRRASIPDAIYRIGSRIEIDYVLQRHRPEFYDKDGEFKQVLEIRVDDSEFS